MWRRRQIRKNYWISVLVPKSVWYGAQRVINVYSIKNELVQHNWAPCIWILLYRSWNQHGKGPLHLSSNETWALQWICEVARRCGCWAQCHPRKIQMTLKHGSRAGMMKFGFKPVKPYTVDYGLHVKQCTNFVCLEPFGGHLVLAVVHRATADRHLPKYNAAVEQITNVPW